MALSIQELYVKIEAEKNAQPVLSEYTSPSQTARWKSWMFVIASIIHYVMELWDEFRAQVEARIIDQEYGSLPWYCNVAKYFQWNASQTYLIVFDENNKPVYDTINESDRIVKYAAAVEGSMNRVILKVAKDNGGNPEKLSIVEYDSFVAYINRMKFAGVRVKCISAAADLLKVDAEVFFVPTANPTFIKSEVEAAINTYLIGLPFNGLIHVEKLRDVMQTIKGVVDVKINSVVAVDSDTGVPVTVNRYYVTHSGYARINGSNPLNSTIVYTASNV